MNASTTCASVQRASAPLSKKRRLRIWKTVPKQSEHSSLSSSLWSLCAAAVAFSPVFTACTPTNAALQEVQARKRRARPPRLRRLIPLQRVLEMFPNSNLLCQCNPYSPCNQCSPCSPCSQCNRCSPCNRCSLCSIRHSQFTTRTQWIDLDTRKIWISADPL